MKRLLSIAGGRAGLSAGLALASVVLVGAAGPAPASHPPTPPGSIAHSGAAPAAAPTPAVTQGDHPVMQPAKDTLAAYHLAPATGEAIDIVVAFRAGAKALRFNLPDTSYVVAVPATRSVTMVVPLQQTTAVLGWEEGPQSLFMLDDRARYARRGEMVVAGQKCTQWEATLEQDKRLVCVTNDGVLVRNESQDKQGRRSLVSATAVRAEPIPEGVFDIPAGYDKIAPQ